MLVPTPWITTSMVSALPVLCRSGFSLKVTLTLSRPLSLLCLRTSYGGIAPGLYLPGILL